jgi:hypothetical protein
MTTASFLVPAAQYFKMSTKHQQCSLETSPRRSKSMRNPMKSSTNGRTRESGKDWVITPAANS